MVQNTLKRKSASKKANKNPKKSRKSAPVKSHLTGLINKQNKKVSAAIARNIETLMAQRVINSGGSLSILPKPKAAKGPNIGKNSAFHLTPILSRGKKKNDKISKEVQQHVKEMEEQQKKEEKLRLEMLGLHSDTDDDDDDLDIDIDIANPNTNDTPASTTGNSQLDKLRKQRKQILKEKRERRKMLKSAKINKTTKKLQKQNSNQTITINPSLVTSIQNTSDINEPSAIPSLSGQHSASPSSTDATSVLPNSSKSRKQTVAIQEETNPYSVV